MHRFGVRLIGVSRTGPLSRCALAVAFSLAGFWGSGVSGAGSDTEKVLRHGERLAQECLSCHRRDGKDFGIPGIVEMSEADIVTALTLYKTGLRSNKVMVSVATSLDQPQMQAVARYLSSLGKR
ncbi:MAG: hypothetical protein ABL901_08010 [Hyphomicrobiaceae bacterium]